MDYYDEDFRERVNRSMKEKGKEPYTGYYFEQLGILMQMTDKNSEEYAEQREKVTDLDQQRRMLEQLWSA